MDVGRAFGALEIDRRGSAFTRRHLVPFERRAFIAITFRTVVWSLTNRFPLYLVLFLKRLYIDLVVRALPTSACRYHRIVPNATRLPATRWFYLPTVIAAIDQPSTIVTLPTGHAARLLAYRGARRAPNRCDARRLVGCHAADAAGAAELPLPMLHPEDRRGTRLDSLRYRAARVVTASGCSGGEQAYFDTWRLSLPSAFDDLTAFGCPMTALLPNERR